MGKFKQFTKESGSVLKSVCPTCRSTNTRYYSGVYGGSYNKVCYDCGSFFDSDNCEKIRVNK